MYKKGISKILYKAMLTTFAAASIAAVMSFGAFAADPFSPRWIMDSRQVWHYRMNDGRYATDAWIHDEVNGDWYLIDVNGNMLAGMFSSYGRYYYLDTVRGTGHYGRLLKNGQSVNGVTVRAETSQAYEGALSLDTLNELESVGYSRDTATEVSGTKHVENGEVTYVGSSDIDSLIGSSSGSSGTTGGYVSGSVGSTGSSKNAFVGDSSAVDDDSSSGPGVYSGNGTSMNQPSSGGSGSSYGGQDDSNIIPVGSQQVDNMLTDAGLPVNSGPNTSSAG